MLENRSAQPRINSGATPQDAFYGLRISLAPLLRTVGCVSIAVEDRKPLIIVTVTEAEAHALFAKPDFGATPSVEALARRLAKVLQYEFTSLVQERLREAITELRDLEGVKVDADFDRLANRTLKLLMGITPSRAQVMAPLKVQSKSGQELICAKLSGANSIEIPRTPLPELAFVMGCLFAKKSVSRHIGYLALFADQSAMVSRLSSCLEAIDSDIQVTTRDSAKTNRVFARIASEPLSRSFIKLTKNGTTLPWAILGTATERSAWLTGYFGCRARWRDQGLSVRTTKDPKRLVEVALLLQTVGVTPLIDRGVISQLLIADQLSFNRLRELRLLDGTGLETELSERLARFRGPRAYSAEQYRNVMELHANDPGGNLSELARLTGIPRMTIAKWVHPEPDGRHNLPPVVKREQRLSELRDEYGLNGVESTAKYYRGAEISEALARVLASRVETAGSDMSSNADEPVLLT